MKLFLSIIASFIILSCNEEHKQVPKATPTNSTNDTARVEDTLISNLIKTLNEPEPRKSTEQIVNEVIKEALLDTFDLHLAPIRVTSVRLFRPEYSNYKSISVT